MVLPASSFACIIWLVPGDEQLCLVFTSASQNAPKDANQHCTAKCHLTWVQPRSPWQCCLCTSAWWTSMSSAARPGLGCSSSCPPAEHHSSDTCPRLHCSARHCMQWRYIFISVSGTAAALVARGVVAQLLQQEDGLDRQPNFPAKPSPLGRMNHCAKGFRQKNVKRCREYVKHTRQCAAAAAGRWA